MRILGITSLYPSPREPENGLFNARQLRVLAAGHPFRLVAPVYWTRQFGPAVPIPEDPFPVTRPRYVYPPGLFRAWHGRIFLGSVRRAARAEWDPGRFDAVYGAFAYPDGWAAARLASAANLPFILKVHGSDVHQLRRDPVRSPLVARAIRSAKAVVAVSEKLAHEVREFTGHRDVRVVWNGVDLARFDAGPRDEARAKLGLTASKPLVLFVGRLEPVKGADLLPAVAARLGPDVSWAVLGNGPLARRVAGGLAPFAASLRARVAHADLPFWYRAADVVLLPSRNEGIPNVLLEAMACDRPVVAADVGGVPEILTDPAAGTLVPPGAPEPFAEAVRRAIDAPPAAGAARRLVLPLSWEASGAALARVFTEVVE